MNGGWWYRYLGIGGTLALVVGAVLFANQPAVQSSVAVLPVIGSFGVGRATGSELGFEAGTTTIVVSVLLIPLFKPRPRRILDIWMEGLRRTALGILALATIGYFAYTYRWLRLTLIATGGVCYQYAQSQYEPFFAMTEPSSADDEYRDRVGFVVTTDTPGEGRSQGSLQARLHDENGNSRSTTGGVSHCRATYTVANRSLTVTQIVHGAIVRGTGPADRSFAATIRITLPPAGTDILNQRRVETAADRSFRSVKTYPGSYDIDGAEITMDERVLQTGAAIDMGDISTE